MIKYYPHVLLVEDDDVDAEALIRAFKRHHMPNLVTHVVDGVEALAVLRGTNDKPPLPEPHLILLDLNLPRMSGLEFLTAIRQDEKLKHSTVFVLTTSYFEDDKLATAKHNIEGYVFKDDNNDGLSQVIQLLDLYQPLAA